MKRTRFDLGSAVVVVALMTTSAACGARWSDEERAAVFASRMPSAVSTDDRVAMGPVARELQAERWISKPAVVFECVGAPGMIERLVQDCEMWTRIYAAGGWYTGDKLDCTLATHRGVTIQFGGGPHPEDWYGILDAICEGRLDPTPSIGEIIDLDGVPDALDRARRGEGPPRIVVHPNGDLP